MKKKIIILILSVLLVITYIMIKSNMFNLTKYDFNDYILELNDKNNNDYSKILMNIEKKINDNNISEEYKIMDYAVRAYYLFEDRRYEELLSVANETEKILQSKQLMENLAILQSLLAQVYLKIGNYNLAYIYSNKANIILSDLYEKDKINKIEISYLINAKSIKAITEQEFNMYEVADKSFEELEKVLYNEEVTIAPHTYVNIAEYYKCKSMYEKVEEYVFKGYEEIKDGTYRNDICLIKLNILLATVYYENDEYEKALSILNQIELEEENLYTVDKVILLGKIYSNVDVIEALKYFKNAYDILENCGISRKKLYVIEKMISLNKKINNLNEEMKWLYKFKEATLNSTMENLNYELIKQVDEINLQKLHNDLKMIKVSENIKEYISIILLLTIFIIIIISSSVVKAKDTKKNRLQNNVDILNKQLKYKLKYYESEKKCEDEIKKYMHDMNNHIITVISLIENNENNRAIKYMAKLSESYEQIKSKSVTKNKIIDSIMRNKIEECKRKNIILNVDIKLPEEVSILDIDLCIIFSNLMDNAVEACDKIYNKKRYINVKSNIVGNYIYVTVENSYDGNIINDGLKFKTLKSNKKIHGSGLENIKSSVIKYDGKIKFDYDEKSFKVSILLKEKNKIYSLEYKYS